VRDFVEDICETTLEPTLSAGCVSSANPLKLSIPAQDLPGVSSLDPHPRILDGWLAALRMANVEESAQRVFDVLRKYNRCQIDPMTRYKAMSLLRPVIKELTNTLKNKYLCHTFSFTEKQRRGANTIKQFLEETAFGYKIIIGDSIGGGKNYNLTPEVLLHSIYYTIEYLSELMLSMYYFYAPEPEGIWGELNRLYHFAEQMGVHEKSLDKKAKNETCNSIGYAYRKIALLAMANPYQLMPGEVVNIYKLLEDWSADCELEVLQKGTTVKEKFVVNLAGNLPPQFVAREVQHLPPTMRLIKLDNILEKTRNLISECADHDKNEQKISPMKMKERMQRDMLIRLERIWGGRILRKNARHPHQSQILLAVGLSTSHHFISGEELFEPERSEVRYYRPNNSERGSDLTLSPVDDQPWKSEQVEERIGTGLTSARISKFNTDTELDIWHNIYATEARVRTVMEAREPDYTAQLWKQTNISAGGIGLLREDADNVHVHVGDVVAYINGMFDEMHWRIGTIRWLKGKTEDTLELGVMNVADKARAVAVRAIGGAGKGGEYFRSLLVTHEHEGEEDNSLIVPANIFDSKTRLVVNMQDEIIYVRLLDLIETTSSFSQFTYRVIAMPDTEKQNIAALRGEKLP
jgi:hypothetical protein